METWNKTYITEAIIKHISVNYSIKLYVAVFFKLLPYIVYVHFSYIICNTKHQKKDATIAELVLHCKIEIRVPFKCYSPFAGYCDSYSRA